MDQIPRDGGLDHTLALLRDGYRFIGDRCERHGSDAFRTRLMLRKAVCMRGAEAAEVFYGGERFTRVGATPITAQMLLQDFGSVQLLDGEAHRVRKAMFMSLMTPEAVAGLAERTRTEWLRRLPLWERAAQITLFDELRAILARAVCAWAGVPLGDGEAERRTRELSEMIEGAGSAGPRAWRALVLRARCERWARGVVARVRSGALDAPEGSALRIIASHQDRDSGRLDVKTAAVELINVLRPTVAVARFMVFAAVALHERPELRERVGDDKFLDAFVQEVRRRSPFFPFVGGRVKAPFEWRGHRFAKGDWVLLDLYGTDHDPARWPAPDAFRPERFVEREPTAFDFVPQGGGEPSHGHRCPGEGIAVALTGLAVRMLATEMRYATPEQDLSVDLSRMPALPRSGFVMRDVRRAP